MDFVNFSPEMMYTILSRASTNDLLRMRRVSQLTRLIAEDILRSRNLGVVIIDLAAEYPNNLEGFLDNYDGILSSATRFHFKNSHPIWLENNDINLSLRRFTELYGKKITHLTIDSLEVPVVDTTLDELFRSMSSLRSLRILKLFESESKPAVFTFPATFIDLDVFEIVSFFPSEITHHLDPTLASRTNFWKVFRQCTTRTAYLLHPFFEFGQNHEETCSDPGIPFETLIRIVRDRNRIVGEKPALEYVDLMGYKENRNYSGAQTFLDLLHNCREYKVKLRNPDATMIYRVLLMNILFPREKLGKTLVSLKNFNTKIYPVELPHLNRIWTEDVEHQIREYEMPPAYQAEGRPAWDNLKELRLVLGGTFLLGMGTGKNNGVPVVQALDYFFRNGRRDAMETLDLEWRPVEPKEIPVARVPTARDIVTSCENLTSLTLTSWEGTNAELCKLWEGLALLKKVELARCLNLDNEAFLGSEPEKPVFRQLEHLEVFKLKELEKMRGITDTLFELVIRHMPLKELCLTSHHETVVECVNPPEGDEWEVVDANGIMDNYPSITLAGIRTLLDGGTGEFVETIEVFSFSEQLKLRDTSKEEMKRVENMFRSSQL